MPTVAKRIAARKRDKSSNAAVEVLLVFGLLGLLASCWVAAYGVDLTPGFF